MSGGPVGVDQHAHFEWIDACQIDASDAGQAFQRFLQVALECLVLVRQIFVG